MCTVFMGFKNGVYIGYIGYGIDIGSCFYDFGHDTLRKAVER